MKKLIYTILLLLLFDSCYKDGSYLTFRPRRDRIDGYWSFKEVLVDGVDSTAAYQQQFTKIEIVSDGNVWAEYTEDAILRFYYNDTTLNYNTCIGTMGKFSAHNTLRDICFSNYDHPMPYALGPLGGVGGQEWKILKLSNVQFWFNVPYNGKKYEFKLKAVKHMK